MLSGLLVGVKANERNGAWFSLIQDVDGWLRVPSVKRAADMDKSNKPQGDGSSQGFKIGRSLINYPHP